MIGTKATEKWGTKFPKFNTPQAKLELSEFSAQLEPVCGIPDVGFNAEGIAKHIQNFCNEQRRYQKLKTSNSKVNALPLWIFFAGSCLVFCRNNHLSQYRMKFY